jgi:hypothetical protein
MKLHRLFHLLALVALVACVPTIGPSLAPPTSTPTLVTVVTTAAPASATPTASGAVVGPPSPTATIAPRSVTSPADATVTPAASSTPSQPQWGHQTKTAGCVVQGPFPDPACTPGDIFPDVTAAQICVSGYSSGVRNVPASEKDAVYAEYGVTHHSSGEYEVDHFVSLELGGSNDISNLFPEAASPTPGFHEKDRVENYLHDQVCKGALTLAEAQREIATDWLAVYQSMAPAAGSSPTPIRVRVTFTPAPAEPTSTQAQQIAPTATEAAFAPSDTPVPPATEAPTASARVRIGALCNDGTDSNATGSGACSGHGGVKCWKYSDGTCTKP